MCVADKQLIFFYMACASCNNEGRPFYLQPISAFLPMTHIVFQPSDALTLQAAAALEPGGPLEGTYCVIEDDFSVGPVYQLYEPEGFVDRKEWWMQRLENSPYEAQILLVDDKLKVHQLLKKLEEGEHVWLWMGQNAHDVMGYYWLMPQLAKYQGQVWVLYLNNLPFFNEKGALFYPAYLNQIPPKEFLKARKLARLITPSEFEVDADETARLMQSHGMVRRLEGGKKLAQHPADYADKQLLALVEAGGGKFGKLFQQFSQQKQYLSDVFVFWRFQEMAAAGMVALHQPQAKDYKEVTVHPLA